MSGPPRGRRWAWETHTHGGGGLVASSSPTAATLTTSSFAVPGATIVFDAAAGHLYRISCSGSFKKVTNTGTVSLEMWIYDTATTGSALACRVYVLPSASYNANNMAQGYESLVIEPGALNVTVDLGLTMSTAGVQLVDTFLQNGLSRTTITIEDLGTG